MLKLIFISAIITHVIPLLVLRTLAEYFHDIDVVPSDFAAGLALLRKYQKHQENVALMRAIEEQQVLDSQV